MSTGRGKGARQESNINWWREGRGAEGAGREEETRKEGELAPGMTRGLQLGARGLVSVLLASLAHPPQAEVLSLPSQAATAQYHFRGQGRVTRIQGRRGTELGGMWPGTPATQAHSLYPSLFGGLKPS